MNEISTSDKAGTAIELSGVVAPLDWWLSSDSRANALIAQGHSTRSRALCQCVVERPLLYLSLRRGYLISIMPGTRAKHSPSCAFRTQRGGFLTQRDREAGSQSTVKPKLRIVLEPTTNIDRPGRAQSSVRPSAGSLRRVMPRKVTLTDLAQFLVDAIELPSEGMTWNHIWKKMLTAVSDVETTTGVLGTLLWAPTWEGETSDADNFDTLDARAKAVTGLLVAEVVGVKQGTRSGLTVALKYIAPNRRLWLDSATSAAYQESLSVACGRRMLIVAQVKKAAKSGVWVTASAGFSSFGSTSTGAAGAR
jgi:hypothetical protein